MMELQKNTRTLLIDWLVLMQFRDMAEPSLDEHATCAAEFCWLTVAPAAGISSERLYKEDLAVMLQNEQEADFAFSLFDLDGDGYVTEPEVHSRIQAMYRCAPISDPSFQTPVFLDTAY
jgi:hypothetical protein